MVGPYNNPAVDEFTHERNKAVSFFHYPPIWVGESAVRSGWSVDFEKMKAEAVRAKAPSSGIDIKATFDGEFVFEFSSWEAARLPPQVGDTTEKDLAKYLLVRDVRVNVLNVFLTGLYTAIFVRRGWIRPMLIDSSCLWERRSLDAKGEGGPADAFRGLKEARNPSSCQAGNPHALDGRISNRLNVVPVDAVNWAAAQLDRVLDLGLQNGLQRLAV